MADEENDGGLQISAGLVGLTLVAVLLAVFIFQNTDDQPVSIYLWEVTAPMWLILLATALVTLVLTEVAGFIRRRRRR
ncbi:MAG: hypothetical protein U5K29_08570 [Acidimicrobiales bacterium]|nr:hypothetical protein [Acidimicrobiales bacterium]